AITPLLNRLVDALPMRVESAGIVIAFALIALLMLREVFLSRLQAALAAPRDLYIDTVEALLIGYLVAARVAAAHAARTVLAAVDDALYLPAARRTRLTQ